MVEPHDFEQHARPLTLQAAVFRCLRERGLEPQLSDTLGRRISPAASFAEQMARIALCADVTDDVRYSLGLYLCDNERRWIHCVVDAASERFERRQRLKQRRVEPHATVPAVTTNTASTTVVVFRKRGGDHGQ